MGELKRVSDRYIGAIVWVRGETFKTESEVADLWQPKWNENKRYLLLGRKAMTNLDSIFKSRDITLQTEVHLVKAMVFPVVMYESFPACESWTIRKAEH